MIKKASINREYYYELIGTEAIFRHDIVCVYTGGIKYNKGDKSIIVDVEYTGGRYTNGNWIEPEILLIEINNDEPILYRKNTFINIK